MDIEKRKRLEEFLKKEGFDGTIFLPKEKVGKPSEEIQPTLTIKNDDEENKMSAKKLTKPTWRFDSETMFMKKIGGGPTLLVNRISLSNVRVASDSSIRIMSNGEFEEEYGLRI